MYRSSDLIVALGLGFYNALAEAGDKSEQGVPSGLTKPDKLAEVRLWGCLQGRIWSHNGEWRTIMGTR